MGFDTSVVVAIFFVAALILGTSAYSTISMADSDVDDASEERFKMEFARLHTDLEITGVDNPDNTSLIISMTNTGSRTIDASCLSVLVDGALREYSYDPPYTWTPLEDYEISVALPVENEHRIKVVTENGVADYYVYMSI
ncbi:flagellin [Methanosalsum zhilinae DSM 4017]|uniref:Flagellin n=1 Tax=Methanosalsum zhilinae (strain DSM 4017 / NBRC 107636 / OCM 62 / WeN5) TaxID=679901 RepID=F7XPY1_METZD|nr:flagellin [Methanosalsum zhilinae]AEH61502.1 flagellin [Methanosalsum zhilinae DSM 4017]